MFALDLSKTPLCEPKETCGDAGQWAKLLYNLILQTASLRDCYGNYGKTPGFCHHELAAGLWLLGCAGAGDFPPDQPPGVVFLFPFWIPEKLHHLLQQMLSEATGLARAFGHRFWECPGRVRKRCTFGAKRQKNSPWR